MTYVRPADFDGDGNLDILAATINKRYLYRNNGNGTFLKEVIDGSTSSMVDIRINDVDGDGDLDLVYLEYYYNYTLLTIQKGDGTGGFGEKESVNISSSEPGLFSMADIDGDGDDDAVLTFAWGTQKGTQWIENDGGDFMENQNFIFGGGSYFRGTLTADMDGDGDPDVITMLPDKVVWHKNDGTGSFISHHLIADNLFSLVNADVADCDNDGDLDLVTISGSGEQIVFHENNDAGSFQSEVIYGGLSTSHMEKNIYFADLDNDGYKDIVATVYYFDLIVGFKNVPGQGFIEGEKINPIGRTSMSYIQEEDVNMDGRMDLLYSNSTGVYLQLNNGTNNFTIPKSIIPCINNAQVSFTISDMDGDGDPDVLASDITMDVLSWYENDGAGSFGNEHIISAGLNTRGRIRLEDMDGDGDSDIVYFDADFKIQWLENEGNGNYVEGGLVYGVPDFNNWSPDHFRISDVDGDGDMDVVQIHEDSGRVLWHNNDGTGNFVSHHLIFELFSPSHMDVNDYNGDGILDIAFTNSSDFYMMQNDGAGNFTAHVSSMSEDISGYNKNIIGFRSADFDADGDLDVAIILATPGQYSYLADTYEIFWYQNDGAGDMGFPNLLDDGSRIYGISAVDWDNDGAIDLLKLQSPIGFGGLEWFKNKGPVSTVSGTTYWDVNGNGIYDEGDRPLDIIAINVQPEDVIFFTGNSDYQLYYEDGTYEINYVPDPDWYLTSDSSSYFINVTDSTNLTNYDFGFAPTDTIVELSSYISSGLTICDETVGFVFSWTNTGTTILKGTANITLDEWVQQVDFNTNLPDEVISATEFSWNFNGLYPGESFKCVLLFICQGILKRI